MHRYPSHHPSTSPSILLTPASTLEKQHHSLISAPEWKGQLTVTAFLGREAVLHATEAARDGGLTGWILSDPAAGLGSGGGDQDGGDAGSDGTGTNSPTRRRTLSGCETLRKRALVGRDGTVTEVIAHGIGSVFCPKEARGLGFGSRMMRELGAKLEGWQGKTWESGMEDNKAAAAAGGGGGDGGKAVAFSFLYSDVGSVFYARHGWKPYPSAHIRLSPASSASQSKVKTREEFSVFPIEAPNIPSLCLRDEHLLRKTLASTPGLSVAVLPTADTMAWFHAREDFVASELFGRYPAAKGSIVEVNNKPLAWCIWTRIYYEEYAVLYILRLVVDSEVLDAWGEGDKRRSAREGKITAVELLFREATREAGEWNAKYIEVWNPDDESIEAGKRVQPAVAVEVRETESITSLRWHGPEQDVLWIANEKFGWC